MSSNGAILELEGVCFHRGGRRILDGVSWRMNTGEHWALLGANGSGKTTLLQIALGYLWPTDGKVTVLGSEYGNVDLRQLRRQIGYVSSSLQAMVRPDQPARNVVLSGAFASTALFDRPDEAQRRCAEGLLEQMGCSHVAGNRFGSLSLGEQQKVLIARAWMSRPKLLILDEPCAGLDLPSREGLLSGIGRMAVEDGGTTLVLVTHHVEEIPPAITHAMVLRDGRVLAAGRKGEVLTGPTLSAAYGMAVEVEARYGRFWPKVNGQSH